MKKLISTSKQPAKHMFDGQNTQHLDYFPSKQKEFNFCNYYYLVSAGFFGVFYLILGRKYVSIESFEVICKYHISIS